MCIEGAILECIKCIIQMYYFKVSILFSIINVFFLLNYEFGKGIILYYEDNLLSSICPGISACSLFSFYEFILPMRLCKLVC